MDLSKLRTDKALSAEGVWVEVLPDIKVKVIATSSVEFKKFATSQMKPFTAMGLEPSVEDAELLGAKAFSHCAVKGWEGVELDGKKIDFTPEAALKIFTEIPEFLQAVVKAATTLDNFRAKTVEAVEGN